MSCDKFINVEAIDSLSGNNYWKDQGDAETFTLEIYRLFREATLLKGPYFIMGELRNAMVTKTGSYPNRWDINYAAQGQVPLLAYTFRPVPGADADRFWTYNVEWDIMDDWKPFYKVVQSSNILYENVMRLADNDKSISPTIVKRYQAEAVFMRSMAYFFMIRLYGDVPYYTNAYNDRPLPRMNHVEVAKKCLEELAAIKEDLPWTYDEPANRAVRGMRGSVIALMMHLNMWLAGFDEGNKANYYGQVDVLGDELTTIGEEQQKAYELLPIERIKEIFQGRSRESFFEISNSVNYQGFVSANSRKMIPFYVLDGYTVSLNQDRENAELAYVTPYMEKLYPEGEPDGRIVQWFDNDPNWKSGSGKFRLYKFVNFEFDGANTARNYANSIMVFRYAESLLLQAEACAGLNNPAKAIALLNRVRGRANATLYPGNGHDSLEEAIFYERGKELMGEGYYFFDLVRTKKIMNPKYTMAPMSFSMFNAGAWTWPINRKALDNNPYMRLNYWNE
jgi:hypothetical protein